ncbi:MAG: hypothetical protein R6X22_07660 [Gemmatimonadota bacterium]
MAWRVGRTPRGRRTEAAGMARLWSSVLLPLALLALLVERR